MDAIIFGHGAVNPFFITHHFDDIVLSFVGSHLYLIADDVVGGSSDVTDDAAGADDDDKERYKEAVDKQEDIVRYVLSLKYASIRC